MFKMKFIYVFSKENRDKLISMGFGLHRSDDSNTTYILSYPNDDLKLQFDISDIEYAESNSLPF